MSLEIKLLEEVFESIEKESRSHLSCCKSDKIAICGKKLRGLPGEKYTTCVVCIETDEMYPDCEDGCPIDILERNED